MSKIDRFNNEYLFLSNFYKCDIHYDGLVYPSVEHAYQAAKTILIDERLTLLESPTPQIAKKLGKHLTIRPEWDVIKVSVMTELVYQKFSNHIDLKNKLLETGDVELVEGNWWGDVFWGRCNGIGENYLGKILMSTRKYLREDHHVNISS